MDLESRIVEAIRDELERQSTAPERNLMVEFPTPPDAIINNGRVDLDKVAMVIAGTLAGGP